MSLVREIFAMSPVHKAYVCFYVLGLILSGLFGWSIGVAIAYGQGNGYIFLFGFGAIILLALAFVEAFHPEKAPYSPPVG